MIIYLLFKNKNLVWNEKIYPYLNFISEERKLKILKYIKDENKIISLLTELLVRYIVIKKLKIKNKDIKFCYNENGKPMLPNDKNFHFSISHSSSAVCAATHDSSVGIDIENYRDVNINIADIFFTPNEKKKLKLSNFPNKTFLNIWTKKEACVKFFGSKFSTEFKKIDVFKENGIAIKTLVFKLFVISVAYKKEKIPIKIKILNKNEILDFFV
jgi:4'-phosphopantetheinyl transferase